MVFVGICTSLQCCSRIVSIVQQAFQLSTSMELLGVTWCNPLITCMTDMTEDLGRCVMIVFRMSCAPVADVAGNDAFRPIPGDTEDQVEFFLCGEPPEDWDELTAQTSEGGRMSDFIPCRFF